LLLLDVVAGWVMAGLSVKFWGQGPDLIFRVFAGAALATTVLYSVLNFLEYR